MTPAITTQPYVYEQQKMADILGRIIRENTDTEVWNWLNQKMGQAADTVMFASAFMQIPRKVPRSVIKVKEADSAFMNMVMKGFMVRGWTADRLCRVWLLLQLDATGEKEYVRKLEKLFEDAELNEQVALYSALPLLAYPKHWQKRCSEGIRSNIGDVLAAIMLYNPYPAGYLPEPAWNQMVLKAFFTEKKVEDIIGLDERANPDLADILTDYAHERWAAHRSVHPQLWRCVGKFINDRNFPDIERIFRSDSGVEKAAAALARNDSAYLPAKVLLNENNQLKEAVETGSLTWNTLSQKTVPIN